MKIHLHSVRHKSQPRSGTAALEMALVAPIIMGLLVGMLEVGRLVQVDMILMNAAREGARNASTGINTYANVQTVVQNYLTNAGITNQTNLTVSVYDVTQSNSGPTFNPSTAAWCDQLQVTVSIPLNNVRLTPLHFLSTDPNTMITAQAVWFSNQDQSYPTSIVPPSGS